MNVIRKALKRVLRTFGYEVVKSQPIPLLHAFPADFDKVTVETIKTVAPYTMTSAERLFALCEAVRYVVQHRIPGDIVECGVWKGGSMMAIARTLLENSDKSRSLYLFDTFTGMAPPQDIDVTVDGVAAADIGATLERQGDKWCLAGVEEVRAGMRSTGYDPSLLHYVEGRVEDTIPAHAPGLISLLRLDTDWYESTRHELIHLFPRLSNGAVLIIDDYGFWKGCRKAVDEYFSEHRIPLLLNRIDNAGRIAVIHRVDSMNHSRSRPSLT